MWALPLPLLFAFLTAQAEAEAPAPAAEETTSGGVAAVVNLPEDDAGLRAVAVGALAAAEERWGMMVPPLKPEAAAVCQADNLCLINLARDRGASHLLVLGVANLGEGEVVLSGQLFEAETGSELLSFTEVVRPGPDPSKVGREMTAAQLGDVPGVPASGEVGESWPPPPAPEVETYSGLSVLALAGWSLTGAGAIVALTGLGLGGFFARISDFGAPWLVGATAVGFGAITVLLVAAGLTVVATDLFLQ